MLVLDCNVAVELAFGSEQGSALRKLFLPDEVLYAPMLLQAEFAHAMKKYVVAGAVDAQRASKCIDWVASFVDEYVDDRCLAVEAFRESLRLNCSSYDMFYFVLARRLGATLLTLDKRLVNICIENGVDCVVPTEL